MDKEIEDKGTDVTDLAGDLEILEVAKSQLRMKNNLKVNDIAIDPNWTDISGVTMMGADICGLLTKKTGGGGVVRVISKPSRYTKPDGLPGTSLLSIGPGEEFLGVGSSSVRYIRYCSI